MKHYYQDDAVTIYHGCKAMRLVVDRNNEKTKADDRGRTTKALPFGIAEDEAGTEEGLRAVCRTHREKKAIRQGSSELEGRQDPSKERAFSGSSSLPEHRAVRYVRQQESGAPSLR